MIEFLGKPLTVERVVQAYEKTGLKPATGLYYQTLGDGTRCACGLGAVAVAEGACEFGRFDVDRLGTCYFVEGFDFDFGEGADEEGYQLGLQCRKAVGL